MIQRLMKRLIQTDRQCYEDLMTELSSKGYTVYVDDAQNFIFAVPTHEKCIPVLLCAHLDTRRVKTGKLADEPVALFRANGMIINDNGILGADDRCGVQLVLEAADQYAQLPFILITDGEESGFTGMKAFIDMHIIEDWIANLYLIVSVDRRGHNQYVQWYYNADYNLDYLMNKHGFVHEGIGYGTDAELLSKNLGIAHVNISYGGYNPHNVDEFILEDSYLGCKERLCSLIQDVRHKYLVTPVVVPKSKANTYSYTPVHKKPDVDTSNVIDVEVIPNTIEVKLPLPHCGCCGKSEASPVYIYNIGAFVCFKCRNRIKAKFGTLTKETLALGKEDLANIQEKTREFNVTRKKQAPSVAFPKCPRCHDNTHVAWSKTNAGFICTSCSLKAEMFKKVNDPQSFNGEFWCINGDKLVYYMDNSVYVQAENRTTLLGVFPMGSNPYLGKCEVCGKVVAQSSIIECVMDFRGEGKVHKVCGQCMFDVNTLYRDSDNRPPWE